ncbi:hypothetical protein AB3N58_09390 [Leptospira sp. WS60.C2]
MKIFRIIKKTMNLVYNKICIYNSEYRKIKTIHPNRFSYISYFRNFIPWYLSLSSDKNPLLDEQPWINFDAMRFLRVSLNSKMKVFEYGAGGSTLFFLNLTDKVFSVEHDETWFMRVKECVSAKGKAENWTGYLKVPEYNNKLSSFDPGNPMLYQSSDINLSNMSFEAYAKSISNYPDDFFDVILLDGRARPSCFLESKAKLKKNGFFILDNAEREHYSFVKDSLRDSGIWELFDFISPGPYNLYFWQTTIWRKIL